MNSFRGNRLAGLQLPLSTMSLLESLAESKGRQVLFEKQSPRLLSSLQEMAVLESAQSSNRIEGVTVEPGRLRPLVLGQSRPRDGFEREIVGYRRALAWIQADARRIPIEPATLRRLHAMIQRKDAPDSGQWKSRPNEIIEVFADGRRRIRFQTVELSLVAPAVEELCREYRDAIESDLPKLAAVAALILDFLCIHPFRDGNGRVSRLLALLALSHHGHDIGRYVSLERVVERHKERYYEVLRDSSIRWHEAAHDQLPWLNYFLFTIWLAYRELEERVGGERTRRGSKTEIVSYALKQVSSRFAFTEIQRRCPSVSRDMVRVVMNRWRNQGRLRVAARGRNALWERLD